MSDERLEISRIGIAKLINDGGLIVPPHQREYSWEERHVTDLYDDLAGAIKTEQSDYFLGSIVIENKHGKLRVFDGQQRLATIMILLAAIRDYLTESGDQERASQINSTFLVSRDFRTLDDRPKLMLGKRDHDYFQKRILSDDPKVRDRAEGTSESHEFINLAAIIAYKHVRKLLAPYRDTEKSKILIELKEFLEDSAMVVCVQVPDDVNAYVVFETMNDRGLTPSAADLLKNYLFGCADNRIEEAERNWIAMAAVLDAIPGSDSDIIVTYIRHIWISKYGPTRTRDLFKSMKTTVKSKQGAVDITSELAVNASFYAAILNPAHELWRKYGLSTKKHIETLTRLGMTQNRPLLLAIVKIFHTREVNKILPLMVSWAVRSLITGTAGSGQLEGVYGRNAAAISGGTIKTARALSGAMAPALPSDDVFQAAFAAARSKKAHLARYYLRALQQQENSIPDPSYVPSDELTLEHILPKSPGSSWKLDPAVMASYCERIGNLVLQSEAANNKMQNSSYAVKKKFLLKSEFSLTKKAGECDAWGPEQIDSRQKRLAKIAVRTWPLKL